MNFGSVAQAKRIFVRSRPLDVHRWSDYPELNRCHSELANEIEAREGRKRSRTAQEAKRFKDALRILVLDLYGAWKTDPALQIGISLRSNDYSAGTRYAKLFLSFRQFKAAYEGLRDCGYLQVDKRGGRYRASGKAWNTKIRATQKLIELLTQKAKIHPFRIVRASSAETILLKNEQKQLIEYPDTAATSKMRENLERINRILLRHWTDLEITDDEFSQLQTRLAGDTEREAIDFTRRTLHRVFNDGSFEKDGRFYGGWWQNVPKEYRRYITINNKPTVELDYSGLHPRILYGLAGLQPPKDPYLIGIEPKHRDLAKVALNAIINVGSGRISRAEGYDPSKVGMEWREFLQVIEEAHKPIAQFFRVGYGLRLQFLDSQMAEQVLLHFGQNDIPCLPVHDSFVMHHGYEDELEQVMQEAFRIVVGGNVPIKAKLTSIEERRSEHLDGDDVLDFGCCDVEELLAARQAYRAYDARIGQWFGGKYTK